MTKTLEVFRFELAHQLRRPSTLAYFFLMLAICTPFVRMLAVGSALAGTILNGPFTVMVTVVFGSMLALLIVAALAADAATRDRDARMHSLFYTSPVGKRPYLLGRSLGAFALSALLLLALPLGAAIATAMPWIDPERVGAFRPIAYLAPYLLFALPTAFIATAVAFALATLTHRAMASYAGVAFLFFFSIVCGKLLPTRVGWGAAKLLDPLGFTTMQELWQSTNSLQKNAYVLALDGPLLANRLLWLGAALLLSVAAYSRFRFAHETARERSLPKSEDGGRRVTVKIPAARRTFAASTRMRQLRAIAMRSFRDLHASRVWWIVPLLAVMFLLQAPALAELEMGVPGPLTTARLLGFLNDDVSLLLTLLVALSAGELVWRERETRLHPLADVTPVPDWLPFAGKFLGLALMLAATHVIFFVTGLAAQTIYGAERYDLRLYVEILFGLQLPDYLLLAALAMLVHVLVNQKYVANALVVLFPIARDLARTLGIEDDLLLYGNLPRWSYSEISGFGTTAEARLWFTLYYAGWALLFALVTHFFWRRGEERGAKGGRLTRAAALIGTTALAIIAGAGGFIFYDTHIAHEYRTTAKLERQRAEFERRYGRYASLPQPRIAATKLDVEFYPTRGTAVIRGSHRLENRGSAPIDAIHVATSSGARSTAVSFDRAARLTLDDEKLDYRIYTLDRALQPGQSLRMDFQVAIETNVFRSEGTPPVVGNGSILIHRPGRGDHWLPVVGYQWPRELNDPALRKKYGLRARSRYPTIADATTHKGYEATDLETIIGTDPNQVGVAPGRLLRVWAENGRRYAHYRTDAPISNAWTIASANYAVHRAKWRNVDIEVFHHPAHAANVERIVRSVRAALDYNTRAFGPYPHQQLRFVELPSDSYWLQMTAHSGLVTYGEGFSLVRPADDPRNIDFPFAVVAHEVAHQWWGHQLTPASVEGAGLLTESLAWYSGMLVVEETFGREHLRRILDMLRAQYLAPHRPRTVPLLRAVDQLDAYRTGPFAMYALRERVGVEPVNRALHNLLAKFPAGRAPYPTSLDFYAELRAATPPSLHGLLKDLFEDITFWDLRLVSMDVQQQHVVLHVEAQKLKGDGTGNERAVPMDDLVEIELYDARGASLYRASHRIHSGAQTIEITVAASPARAEIDPDRELLDREPKDNSALATHVVAAGLARP
ncbi:MAG TPA: M1 family aminopeptidase [Thermoanaerobaculia bacterium]|nr:M1 family aminopeptidase [Thermoanaerobaculia bacterium]